MYNFKQFCSVFANRHQMVHSLVPVYSPPMNRLFACDSRIGLVQIWIQVLGSTKHLHN